MNNVRAISVSLRNKQAFYKGMQNILALQQTDSKKPLFELLFCAGLALFWVLFLWNFWTQGIYALGFNVFVFLSLYFGLFVWTLHRTSRYTQNDLIWIIPFGLLITSFAIYDNPFVKLASMPVLLILFALFYNYALITGKKTIYWDYSFLTASIGRFFSFIPQISSSILLYANTLIPAEKTAKNITFRIMAGILIFVAIAFIIFIPLLSSADALFSEKMQVLNEWIQHILSLSIIHKVGTFIVFSILFFALISTWSKPFNYEENGNRNEISIDSIISGIVLSGILCIYLLFLWIQINRLLMGTLPFDFKETEHLVKSGFWQLLALSIINILIYFFAYRKTIPLVQKLLAAFTIASLLLLFSAGQRMGLYVTYYGFSYEKFFASYTVLYCAVVFLWLSIQLFQSKKANIGKFLLILFLWMFAGISLFPVEQFIFHVNMALSRRTDSRILVHEMKMLSPDALSAVRKYQRQGLLEDPNYDWNQWIEEQERTIAEKRWYERNVINIINMYRK